MSKMETNNQNINLQNQNNTENVNPTSVLNVPAPMNKKALEILVGSFVLLVIFGVVSYFHIQKTNTVSDLSSERIAQCLLSKTDYDKGNCLITLAGTLKDKKVCQSIADPNGRNICLYNVYASEKNSTQCNNFTTQEQKEGCYSWYAATNKVDALCEKMSVQNDKDGCYLTTAQSSKDIKLCDKIVGQTWKGICLSYFAGEQNDVKICNQVSGNGYFECVTRYARKVLSYSVCDNLTDSADNFNCKSNVAMDKRDMSYCKGLSTAEQRDGCINSIALTAKDSSLCGLLETSIYKNSCIDYFKNNPSESHNLGGPITSAPVTSSSTVTSSSSTFNSTPLDRDQKRLADMRQIASDLELYFNQCNSYPIIPKNAAIVLNNTESLSLGTSVTCGNNNRATKLEGGIGTTSSGEVLRDKFSSAPIPQDLTGVCDNTNTTGAPGFGQQYGYVSPTWPKKATWNDYVYFADPIPSVTQNVASGYQITFCLGNDTGGYKAGKHILTPAGIY